MTDNFEKKVAVDGPVVNAGELGSSTFSPGQALPAGPLGLGQRWTVARKREGRSAALRGEPVELLSRQLGVEIFRLEQWREKAIGGIDASLKRRKGDPVQAELDSAMKRIGELTMQVELLEAKTETSGPWGGGGRGDECRHLARHGSGLRACGGSAPPGAWPAPRSTPMTSGQHAEQPPAKRRGPKARDLGTRRCWWRSKPTWRHRPGRARATARSGLGFGSVATSGLPASGCSA